MITPRAGIQTMLVASVLWFVMEVGMLVRLARRHRRDHAAVLGLRDRRLPSTWTPRKQRPGR